MGTALALAMGADPRRLGRFGFHAARSNEVVDAVGGLILSSGLMEMLPVPDGRPGARRRQRPEVISARRAVIELACWSDAPGRTAAFAAEVLRDRAAALEASGFDLFRDTELLAAPTAGMRATSRELAASTR